MGSSGGSSFLYVGLKDTGDKQENRRSPGSKNQFSPRTQWTALQSVQEVSKNPALTVEQYTALMMVIWNRGRHEKRCLDNAVTGPHQCIWIHITRLGGDSTGTTVFQV
ncbi:hypothetical protein P4O66_016540, partial [Electrophorus voltai]